jgi:hypothetical protein
MRAQEVMCLKPRRRQGAAGAVGEHQANDAWVGIVVELALKAVCGERRDSDRPDAGRGLRRSTHELSCSQLHDLFRESDLAAAHIDRRPT